MALDHVDSEARINEQAICGKSRLLGDLKTKWLEFMVMFTVRLLEDLQLVEDSEW